MALRAPEKNTSSNFKKQDALEPGTYPARVVRVVDNGLQPQRPYKGEEKAPAYTITVTYELVDVFMQDEDGNDIEDKPRWISEEFPLNAMSADLAKSTKRMKAIDPENDIEGDWSQTLSSPCMVTVGNYVSKKNGQTYDQVTNVTTCRARDAQRMPELKNEAKFFDLGDPDIEFFNSLPKWIQEKIQGNLEYAGSALERALGGEAPAKKKEAPKKEAEPEAHEDEATSDEDTPW